MACLWVSNMGLAALGRSTIIGASACGLALGLSLVGGPGVAAAAVAHSKEIGNSPAAPVVAHAPDAVSVTFDEPLRSKGAVMRVLTGDGDVGEGKPTTSHKTLRRDLEKGAPAGLYTVEWRAVSADGHRVSGSFTFTAARSNGDSEPTDEATDEPTDEPIDTPTNTALAAPPAQPPSSADSNASSGFTVLPLTLGGLLVLASGLIAVLNKRHLRL